MHVPTRSGRLLRQKWMLGKKKDKVVLVSGKARRLGKIN